MPKRKTSFASNEIYHVYNRGVDKRVIFNSEHDLNRFCLLLKLCNGTRTFDINDKFRSGSSFIDIFNMEVGDPIVKIHAWALMPNHFHLVLSEINERGISSFMKNLTGSYSKYFNLKDKRTGSLFEGRFKSKHADLDTYVKYLFSYVSLNRIKLIDDESEWKEKGIKDLAQVRRFLEIDQYSSLMDYIQPKNKRLFGSITNTSFYSDYFSISENIWKEIFDWLEFDKDGTVEIANVS